MSVIAFDFDDVILPVAEHIFRYYKKTYGIDVPPQHYYGDPRAWGVDSLREVSARVVEHLYDPAYMELRPSTETIEAVKQISHNNTLHIVTGRPVSAAVLTQKTLDDHLPDVFNTVHYIDYNGARSRTKAEVCRQIGAELLIEDNPAHALKVAQAGIPAVLFGDYAWNKTLTGLPLNISRALTWEQVLSQLRQ